MSLQKELICSSDNPDHLYDELARSLFGKFSRMADGYRLRIAKHGNKDRNAALRTALEHAEADFTQSVSPGAEPMPGTPS